MASITVGKSSFSVGDMLFIEYVGNMARKYSSFDTEKTTYFTIDSIGRKYFYANGHAFDKKTLKEKTKYCQNYKIWECEQHYLDWAEYCRLEEKIKSAFSHYSQQKFELSQLREVVKILGL